MNSPRLEATGSDKEVELPKLIKSENKRENQIRQYQAHIEEIYDVTTDENDPKLKEVIRIAKTLEGDTKYKGKIKYKLINHFTDNAFACGSDVYIYTGILSSLKTEGEIAGLLAHEITHIENGDTWNENNGLRTLAEEISRGRVQEYLADNVSSKLRNAGYNPLAYEGMLAMFAEKTKSSGFTHGNAADRQALYRSQFYLLDNEATATGKNPPKSDLFNFSSLEDTFKDSTFEQIDKLGEEKKFKETPEILESLGLDSLMKYLSHLTSTLSYLEGRIESAEEGYITRSDLKKYKKRFVASVKLLNLTLETLSKKIDLKFPDKSDAYRTRLKSTIISELATGQIYALVARSHFASEYLGIKLNDPSIEFEKTFETPDDILQLATDSLSLGEQLEGMNVITYDKWFPNTIFSLERRDGDDSGLGFIGRHLEKFFPKTLAGFLDGLKFLDHLGDNLKVIESKNVVNRTYITNEIHYYARRQINVIGEELVRKYKGNGSRRQIFEKYADELIEKLAEIVIPAMPILRKYRPETTEMFLLENFDTALYLGKHEATVYSSSDWTRKVKEGVINKSVEAKRETEVEVKEFMEAFEDEKKRHQYYSTLNLEKIQSLVKISGTRELIPNHYEMSRFIRNMCYWIMSNYEPTEKELEIIYLIAQRRANYPELKEWKDTLTKEDDTQSALNKLGLGKKELRALACIELFKISRSFGELDLIFDYMKPADMTPATQVFMYDSLLRITNQENKIGSLEEIAELQELILGRLKDSKEIFAFFKKVKKLLKQDHKLSNPFHTEAIIKPLIKKVVEAIINLETDLKDPEDWKLLYELSELVFEDDSRFKSQVQYFIAENGVKHMDFEQGFDFLEELLAKDALPASALRYFQENKMRSMDEMKKVSTKAEEMLANLQKYGDGRIAVLSSIDYLFERVLESMFESIELLEASLESNKDDTKLRKILAKVYYGYYHRHLYEYNKNKDISKILKRNPFEEPNFISFDVFVEEFYRRTSQIDVDVTLHKLLLSPHGVLRSKGGKEKLVNLIKEEVDESDPKFQNLILEIARAGVNQIDPVRIYKPIADILRNRMFIKPESPGDNRPGIDAVKKPYLGNTISGSITNFTKTRNQRKFVEELFALKKAEREKTGEPLISAKNRRLMRQSILKQLQIPEREQKKEKTHPIDYVLSVAKNMGAVGVRFLQLLGQYMEIPEEYKAKFEEVYDGVNGQLKWTAYKTLEREANSTRATPELKYFFENLRDLSPSIGGGSLMTVYVATLKDGTKHVIKVLNPNAEEFIRQNIDDARKILKFLKKKSYAFAEYLLQDLEEWLMEDINSEHKVGGADDPFAKINPEKDYITSNGETVIVSTPKITPTGTKYIMIEEYIEGKNLKEVLSDKNIDGSKYIEATEQSYQHQLETYSEDGKTKAHSDVHIGNVRLGNDGKLYWIDRGHYIESEQREMSVFLPLLSGKPSKENMINALKYLYSLDENKKFRKDIIKPTALLKIALRLTSVYKETKKNKQDDFGEKALLELRKIGLKVPIRISLLFKNAKVLAKLRTS